MSRVRRTPEPCTNCGTTPEHGQRRHGYCGACYQRWNRAGRPATVPEPQPRIGRPDNLKDGRAIAAAMRREHVERNLRDFRAYLAEGLPLKAAARRLNVSISRGQQYRRILIQRGQMPAPDPSTPNRRSA